MQKKSCEKSLFDIFLKFLPPVGQNAKKKTTECTCEKSPKTTRAKVVLHEFLENKSNVSYKKAQNTQEVKLKYMVLISNFNFI
jgi:hypothetical protein